MLTIQRIARVFSEAFNVPADQVSANTVPDDVEKWDSLGHITMVNALQSEFGVEFEIEEIMEMATVSKILEILAVHGFSDNGSGS